MKIFIVALQPLMKTMHFFLQTKIDQQRIMVFHPGIAKMLNQYEYTSKNHAQFHGLNFFSTH